MSVHAELALDVSSVFLACIVRYAQAHKLGDLVDISRHILERV